MASIKEFLTKDHRDCDEIFAQMEESVANGSPEAVEKFEEFHSALMHHFDMEEKVMFPAFEAKTGMTQGPTAVMRMEHEQMRNLMSQMVEAVGAKENNKFFGLSETLMILMQQHNMKEEQMLYTMAQQHLSAQADEIIKQMEAV